MIAAYCNRWGVPGKPKLRDLALIIRTIEKIGCQSDSNLVYLLASFRVIYKVLARDGR